MKKEKKENTFDQIAEWLNRKGYLSVHGINSKVIMFIPIKKKGLKDEKLERDYPEVWSDFSRDLFDKTLADMFENLLE